MGYRLVDAETRAACHPDTFGMLARDVRENVSIGACAKLIFLSNDPGTEAERMWVIITDKPKKLGPQCDIIVYEGTLSNTPTTDVGISYGERVVFGPEHIIDVGVV
jgi:hypothetical protein